METSQENERSSASSSIPPKFKYDVFLSFHGKDTRKNFTSHLLAALKRHGFLTFMDEKELERGECVDTGLLKGIEESKILVVVLSKNYATSHWCLDELVKIMECRETSQQIVLPIFYDVAPSNVRAQAKAFAKHENDGLDGRVEKWGRALTEVANVSGWDLPEVANGDEAHFVRKVIEEVQNKLHFDHLNVACHKIGLVSRLQNLEKLLNMESNRLWIVAIWGMGGVGKTTIAKELYNLIQHKFEGSSFLANIRETSKQPNGLVVLQEQLLADICGIETHDLRNFHHGIEVIKQRAFRRKVLLILDDVDDVRQLEALAMNQVSFGSGCRIIITTRDISSLNLLKVDRIYKAEELNEDESLELFSWHCFHEEHPPEDLLNLSSQIVHYAGGLPLALEVLGSYLYGKSIPEWRSAILKLGKPHVKIQEKLMISFDSLSEEAKELFLDISCFFVGEDRDFIVKILERCRKFAEDGIRDLANRCLVKYQHNNIVMHDLVRDMGREIVRQESVGYPGKRSRLWYNEDVCNVLRDGMGTEAVKGLLLKATDFHVIAQPFNRLQYHENVLEVPRDGMGTEVVEGCLLNTSNRKDDVLNAKLFEKMSQMINLWLLHLDYAPVTAGCEHFSKRLLWLSWKGFPLESIPSNLYMEELVALDLRCSNLKKVWDVNKCLDKLKFLYLSHCHCLTRTPNFDGLKSLEELLLNDCKSLVEVDESITCLNKLVVLDMKNCTEIRKLPSGILLLKCLERLDLSGCSMLVEFSGFEVSTSKFLISCLSSFFYRTKRVESNDLSPSRVLCRCLKELTMENCNLSCLPNEVGNLISLETLDLSGNNLRTLPNGICDLACLKYLRLSGCNLSRLPNEIGRLILLETLSLEGNCLPTLPNSFCNLACLKSLDLNDCNLSHLPDQIGKLSSLVSLYLERNNFCRLPNSFSDLASLEKLELRDCRRLQSLPRLPVKLRRVDASYCAALESIPTEFNWQAGLSMYLLGCNMLARNNFANDVVQSIDQFLSENKRNREWSEDSQLEGMTSIYLPGHQVPSWFQFQHTGSKLSLVVPSLGTRRILGWSLCIVFRTHGNHDQVLPLFIFCHKPTTFSLSHSVRYQGRDQMVLLCFSSDARRVHGGDELEIEINPEPEEIWVKQERRAPLVTVKKCGINFIYEGDDCTEMPLSVTRKRRFIEVG